MKSLKRHLTFFLVFFCTLSLFTGYSYSETKSFTANVMAPLLVNDWADFERQLSIAKDMGVDAVSVDVWWGKVEGETDQRFDWQYYDQILAKIESAQLHWVPIMSFHQCGGNVGDNCDIPIPSWIWNRYEDRNISPVDLKYKSEQGNFSTEVVSLWADSIVMHQYTEFMQAFEEHFGSKHAIIEEINISCGSAGELRYPSYNSHDQGAGYPSRGALQCYSSLAVQDFRNKMLEKYSNLEGINAAWGTALQSVNNINPPSNADAFFYLKDHLDTQYGKDFIDWYNQSLIDHGKRMTNAAIETFDEALKDVEIGIKIPGVHWRMGDPHNPRIAEITAGLLRTSIDYNSRSEGYGYKQIISTLSAFNDSGRELILHFTCLEMGNENWSPQYSRAKDLVFWVSEAAASQGVTIKGENALNGGVRGDFGWDNIENAIEYASYTGLTVLRMADVTTASDVGKNRYNQLIMKYQSNSDEHWENAYLRGTPNNWGITPMERVGDHEWKTQQTFDGDNPRFKISHYEDWSEAYPAQDYHITQGQGVYEISFNDLTKNIVIKKSENGMICWENAYFRGTPNNWETTPMEKVSDCIWKIISTFGEENPRFKISRHEDWSEAYPDQDYSISQGPGNYEIIFNDTTKNIAVRKITEDTKTLTIHFREWESANTYYIHAWDGYNRDIAMKYEGEFNGRHWWIIEINDAPSHFKFCFKNSNNHWDGVNRSYSNQAAKLYVLAFDETPYIVRP